MSSPTTPQFKSFLISRPVQKEMAAQDPAHPAPIPVIITVVEDRSGVVNSKKSSRAFLEEKKYEIRASDFYIFAELLPADIRELAAKRDWVSLIWKDETIRAHLLLSTETIKATACWRTFESRGQGITWAILDTGIKTDHPHLQKNIDQTLRKNFSNSPTPADTNAHGRNMAGH